MTPCIIWTGKINNGYGYTTYLGKLVFIHRLTALQSKILDSLDNPLYVLHRCGNKLCYNSEHLYLGDASRNAKDSIQHGTNYNSKKTHCKNGHELSGDNLLIGRYKDYIYRYCKICRLESYRKRAVKDKKKK